jgi:general secretion pathway protein G
MRRTILNADGFTLMEVIIAVAIVAIMAGAIAPVVFHELNTVRSEATSRELDRIKGGLLDFYEDTGRFPTEAEGLAALITDPGVTGWEGPYFTDSQQDLATAIARDNFGETYVYDLNPNVSPPASVDLLLVSPGVNHALDAGAQNQPWDLAATTDDLFVVISASAINRSKEDEVATELEIIAAACRQYFQDHAGFPNSLAVLDGTYLDPGFQNALLVDAWNTGYQLVVLGGTPPSQRVYSFGPDQQDDNGADDDLAVLVSSVPPGRQTTLSELEIAQAALNGQPTLPLIGGWAGAGGIREALGLVGTFDNDGWGSSYGVNVASRVVFSPGPDANPNSLLDNMPVGVGP